MKIFVTGATGFIGRHLVRRLVEAGHEVRCLVRKSSNLEPLCGLGIEIIYGEVMDQAVLRRGMAGCHRLFHLANLYSMWEPDPARFSLVNVDGTRAVLETAQQIGIQKTVYVSTVAVFGHPEEAMIDERSTPGPVLFSEYARSKAMAERIAWDFYRHGLPLVILYPGIVLGAGDEKASGHYIQDILRRRVPSTIFHHSYATYVYVEDVVEAMLRAAEKEESSGQKYLLGKYSLDGKAYTDLISQVSGVRLPLLHFPDSLVLAAAYLLTAISKITRRPPLWGLSVDAAWTLKKGFRCDGRKAEQELGIRYTPVQQALEEAVAYYEEMWQKKQPAREASFTPSPYS